MSTELTSTKNLECLLRHIFSHVRPFCERAVNNLDRSMHRSLWVQVAHSSFIVGSHRAKNMASSHNHLQLILIFDRRAQIVEPLLVLHYEHQLLELHLKFKFSSKSFSPLFLSQVPGAGFEPSIVLCVECSTTQHQVHNCPNKKPTIHKQFFSRKSHIEIPGVNALLMHQLV